MRKALVGLLLLSLGAAQRAHADQVLTVQGQQVRWSAAKAGEKGAFDLVPVGKPQPPPPVALSRTARLDRGDEFARGFGAQMVLADSAQPFRRLRAGDNRDGTLSLRYFRRSQGFDVITNYLDLTLDPDGQVRSGYGLWEPQAIPRFRPRPEAFLVARCRAAVPGSATLAVLDSTWMIERLGNRRYALIIQMLFQERHSRERATDGWIVKIDASSGHVLNVRSAAQNER